jgi:superfamily II DNA or RNA helicase
MELRAYQKEAVDAVLKGFEQFDRQLLVAATGAGKTVVFSHLAQRFQPKKTLVLCHRDELVRQAVDKLKMATGLVATVEKAEAVADLDAAVTVASVQTLVRETRRSRFPSNHFGLIVADEAHHAVSDSWQSVLGHFTGAKILGVTATPDRGDFKNLGTFFENVACEIGLFDLIRQGHLCRILVKSLPLGIDLTGVHRRMGDLAGDELGHTLEQYFPRIVGASLEYLRERKTLAFLPLCSTSERFAAECRRHGLRAAHISGDSTDRQELLEQFADGRIQLLSNAMLLTEGFDLPSIDCILALRPTTNRSLFAQMIGRGTRVCEGKENLLLLDFLFKHEKLSLSAPAHLVAENEREAGDMAGRDGELEAVARNVRAERESRLAEELRRNRQRTAKTVDIIEFACDIHDVSLADYQATMRWELEAPTEKQMAFLVKAGFDAVAIQNKGHASKIISALMQRRAQGLATAKQLKYLKAYGFHNPAKATFEEATAFLDTIFKKPRTTPSATQWQPRKTTNPWARQ